MEEYKVKPDEDFIDPEEALADSISGLSKIERPISNTVFNLLFLFFLAVLGIYLLTIIKLQVFSAEKLREIALQNISLSYFIPPARGVIYDRQGKELAYSIPEFEVVIVSKYLPKTPEDLNKFKQALGSASGKDLDEVHEILDSQKNNALISFEKNLDKSKAIQISQLKLPGVFVVPLPKRVYGDGPYFSHIIGYINKVSNPDLQKDDYYKLQDKIGRSGIEAFYEEILRGVHGVANFSKEFPDDNFIEGRPRTIFRQAQELQGRPGNSLVLNINSEAQKKLFFSLDKILRGSGLTRGAAIVQNPYSGAVVAMVSIPSFDNNIFQEELDEKEFKKIFLNKNKPLLNRAIGGLYSPGSTIKPLLALAALKEGVINPETTITDTKGYITIRSQFDPDIFYTFRDWKIQGTVNLRRAIAHSSDIYFYSVGGGHDQIKGLGISKIADYLKHFFADQILDIDLPGEAAGFVPTESWKLTKKGEPWYKGDTFNISIGQGDLIITPLWLNTYISAITNGGILFKPQVASRVVDIDKKILQIFSKEELGRLDLSEEIINEVKRGMRETVISGTGWILSSLPVPVAAKTGTAEVIKGRSANSLISVFGPYQDPEIALTIIIEGIGPNQQGLALQAAKDFLGWYFAPMLPSR